MMTFWTLRIRLKQSLQVLANMRLFLSSSKGIWTRSEATNKYEKLRLLLTILEWGMSWVTSAFVLIAEAKRLQIRVISSRKSRHLFFSASGKSGIFGPRQCPHPKTKWIITVDRLTRALLPMFFNSLSPSLRTACVWISRWSMLTTSSGSSCNVACATGSKLSRSARRPWSSFNSNKLCWRNAGKALLRYPFLRSDLGCKPTNDLGVTYFIIAIV